MALDKSLINDLALTMGFKLQEENSFFAISNEENKALVKLIDSLTELKSNKTTIINYSNGKLTKLQDALKGTQREFEQNLKLIAAFNNQVSSESHLKKLADQEESRYFQQIEDIRRKQAEINDQDRDTRTKIQILNESLEFLTENIQIAKDMLFEWKRECTSNKNTNDLIEKYCTLDKFRAESLESTRYTIQTAIEKHRSILINSYEEQKTLEQTLERTSQMYRQAHLDRRNVVHTWKEAVIQMTQREHNIQETENELERSREMTKIKTDCFLNTKQKYEMQVENNKNIELHIIDLCNGQAMLREKNSNLQSFLQMSKSDLMTLRKEIQNLAYRLAAQRNLNRKLADEENQKENLLRKNVGFLENLKTKNEHFKSKTLSAQERLRQLDEFVENEKTQIQYTENEISRLTEAYFRVEREVNSLQKQDKTIHLQSQSIESSINRVRTNNKNDKHKLLQLLNIMYQLELSLQQTEIRSNSMKGLNSGDEDLRLEDQVRSLTLIHNMKKKSINQFQEQILKMEDDLRKMTSSVNDGKNELDSISGKLKEKRMIVEGGEKILKIKLNEIQKNLVETNLLRMRVKHIEKDLARQKDKSFTLEKHKMELEAIISERLLDIKSQIEILLLNRKYLVEEQSQLHADLSERQNKIEILKKRYECASDLLGKNVNGSLVTVTQIKIEKAQERHVLLNEGNILNEKVLKAEEDIKIMENTLKFMNSSNEKYKKSFEKIEDDSYEIQCFKNLQIEYCQNLHKLKNLRKSLAMNINLLQDISYKKEEIERNLNETERNRLDNNDILLKIQKEFIDQREKLDRAERELKLTIKAVRRKYVDSDFLRLFERDLNTREIEERDNSALQQLADCVDTYPDIGPSVTRYLYEKGLKIPSRGPVWRSSDSISDYGHRVDRICSRMSQKSFMSSSSTPASSSASANTKTTTRASAAMSVVNLDFLSDNDLKNKRK
ncbi:coiled-coil domain-containing protein 39 [Culicoides brevitarsis]|uniref:coiled-coil domain-containing protein 39 n=1 Tax=Culicoides brevitarsis TaxID=469753 RepID=UPI00307B85CE